MHPSRSGFRRRARATPSPGFPLWARSWARTSRSTISRDARPSTARSSECWRRSPRSTSRSRKRSPPRSGSPSSERRGGAGRAARAPRQSIGHGRGCPERDDPARAPDRGHGHGGAGLSPRPGARQGARGPRVGGRRRTGGGRRPHAARTGRARDLGISSGPPTTRGRAPARRLVSRSREAAERRPRQGSADGRQDSDASVRSRLQAGAGSLGRPTIRRRGRRFADDESRADLQPCRVPRGLVDDACEEVDGHPTDLLERLVDGRQGRDRDLRHHGVVEADDGEILRDADPSRPRLLEHRHRHLVVAGEDGRRTIRGSRSCAAASRPWMVRNSPYVSSAGSGRIPAADSAARYPLVRSSVATNPGIPLISPIRR